MKTVALTSAVNLTLQQVQHLLEVTDKKSNAYWVLNSLQNSPSISEIHVFTNSAELKKHLSSLKIKKLKIKTEKSQPKDLSSTKVHYLFFSFLNNLPETAQVTQKAPQLFLSDVDGVLTDAGMYYTESGDEIKKFSTYDGMGFKLMQAKGVKVGILTAENRKLNRNRAAKLKLDYDFHGIENKLETLSQLLRELSIDWKDVAYVGDDLNDIEVLKKVGQAFCPANAVEEVQKIKGIRKLKSSGGQGVVREIYKNWF
jgi:YrbI family 3-deoxy-D-manno-octulosonate 8-phosphate phosphatase